MEAYTTSLLFSIPLLVQETMRDLYPGSLLVFKLNLRVINTQVCIFSLLLNKKLAVTPSNHVSLTRNCQAAFQRVHKVYRFQSTVQVCQLSYILITI